jgi:hypothetical protein
MTDAKITSFVDAAITNACGSKSSYAKCTALVEERNEPHFPNRIGGAWAALVNERNSLRIRDKEDNTTLVKDMPIKPEQFLSLCQFLMNQSCWAARRYTKALQENADQEAISGVSGIDFSQDVAADLGIAPISTTEIEEAIDSDYVAMLKLHSVMSSKMSYLNHVDDLYVYADKEQEGENWRIVATAMDFSEAQPIMDAVLVKMQEREDANLSKDMATMDFAA